MKQDKIDLADHKYRVCTSSSQIANKVVFYCELDQLHEPTFSFLGKPIYFQSPKIANLSFPTQTILDEDFVNISRISPQSVYLTDLGLKTLCANLAPDLVLDNSSTPFQTICEVPISSVIHTFSSKETFYGMIQSGTKSAELLNELVRYFPQYCNFGVVGRHTFMPSYQGDEIDLVLFARDLETLTEIRRITSKLSALDSKYVAELWPLTSRTTDFGVLDFFFHPETLPHPLFSNVAHSIILDYHHEFDAVVEDDFMSILPSPAWRLSDRKYLLSVDTAMRGRIKAKDCVTGVGLLCEPIRGTEVIVIQDASNITTYQSSENKNKD